MVSEDLPPILDAAQVAELLGMNVQMVRRYAREGRLPAYKLPGGRTFKFFRDEIFEFVRSHPVIADPVPLRSGGTARPEVGRGGQP